MFMTRVYFRKVFFIVSIYLLAYNIAFGGISVTGGLSHERIVQPGKKYTGTITIYNDSKKPEQAYIAIIDYLFNHEGKSYTLDLKEKKNPRSNGAWIGLSSLVITVPPRGTNDLKYTIKVPENKQTEKQNTSSLVGTYWSSILVHGEPRQPDLQKPDNDQSIQISIGSVFAYNIQIITHIGETGSRSIEFLDVRKKEYQNKSVLEIDIKNIGERSVSPLVWVQLKREDKPELETVESTRYRIYPTTSKRFIADISKIFEGMYEITVIADCGEDNIFAAVYPLKITKDNKIHSGGPKEVGAN